MRRFAFALLLAAVAAGGDHAMSTFVNAIVDGDAVHVFYAGRGGRGVVSTASVGGEVGAPSLHAGTMLCIAAHLRGGFEVAPRVGAAGDRFFAVRASAFGPAPQDGALYAQPTSGAATWDREAGGDVRVIILGEEDDGYFLQNASTAYAAAAAAGRPHGGAAPLSAVQVFTAAEAERALHAWHDGISSLYAEADFAATDRDAAEAYSRARRALTLAAALGDANAGAIMSLATLAGALPVSPGFAWVAGDGHSQRPADDDQGAGVVAGDVGGAVFPFTALDAGGAAAREHVRYVQRMGKRGSWLAKLAVAHWRTAGAYLKPDCDVAVQNWLDVLEDVARPGAASPEQAVAPARHAMATPNELLVEYWMRSDGYETLLGDAIENAAAAMREVDGDGDDGGGQGGGHFARRLEAAPPGQTGQPAQPGQPGQPGHSGQPAPPGDGGGTASMPWNFPSLVSSAFSSVSDFMNRWWPAADEADNDVIMFDGVHHLAQSRPVALDAAAVAYHARRAIKHKDAHAALALADALLDGRVTDGAALDAAQRALGDDAGTPATRLAARYYEIAVNIDDVGDGEPSAHAATALAEMLLGGYAGVSADVQRAKALVARGGSWTTPLGVHLRGVVGALEGNESAARNAFEAAMQAGHGDAFVSLALLDERRNATAAAALLQTAWRDHGSLTAPYVLAKWHYDGLLDDDDAEPGASADGHQAATKTEHFRARRRDAEAVAGLRCAAARNVLVEAVQQTWDAEVGFGMGDALARAALSWEPRPLAYAVNSALRRTGRNAHQRSAMPAWPEALAERVKMRAAAHQKRLEHRWTLDDDRVPLARGAYRMFATLGLTGIRAAHVNAAFVLQRLAAYEMAPAETAAAHAAAKAHYQAALLTTAAPPLPLRRGADADGGPEARPAVAAVFGGGLLERAEARRNLGDCWRTGWHGACAPSLARALPLYEAAAAAGSEWARLAAARTQSALGLAAAARTAADACADASEWPYRAPCALYASYLAVQGWLQSAAQSAVGPGVGGEL